MICSRVYGNLCASAMFFGQLAVPLDFMALARSSWSFTNTQKRISLGEPLVRLFLNHHWFIHHSVPPGCWEAMLWLQGSGKGESWLLFWEVVFKEIYRYFLSLRVKQDSSLHSGTKLCPGNQKFGKVTVLGEWSYRIMATRKKMATMSRSLKSWHINILYKINAWERTEGFITDGKLNFWNCLHY